MCHQLIIVATVAVLVTILIGAMTIVAMWKIKSK
ncbi:hypothetical protein X953_01695 [Virgibacillus sp. SK37]|nr:hypothetical protein X953_01695 [Virgibacillus sp. SK37]